MRTGRQSRRGRGPQQRERARHLADHLQGDAGVEGGGVELSVPEKTWITRMSVWRSSRCVAKLWRSVCIETRLSSLAGLCGGVAGAGELTRGDRLGGLLAGEQPAARALHPPPLPQQVEEVGREHREAVLEPLACSTRMGMRALSMSATLRLAISETRRPQPWQC